MADSPGNELNGSCHCQKLRWKITARPATALACNCTVCRRYGVLWAYGHQDEDIFTQGESAIYLRDEGTLEFHFCPRCAAVAWWRAISAEPNGQRRMAVNLRLCEEPAQIQNLALVHSDGLGTMQELPRNGRCVADVWF